MNKNKLIARIIAGVLATITLFGMIVPYVMAAEIESTTSETVNAEDFEIATPEEIISRLEGERSETSDNENIGIAIDDNETENQTKEKGLPEGFEYVDMGGIKLVKKTEGNDKPAIIIDGLPIGFDTRVVTVFIGNLQTHEVTYYDLYDFNSYVSSVNLEDGYYVIFANGYAWSDAEGNAHAINGGEYQYIYVGDDYDDSIYGVDFEKANEPISIGLGAATEDMKVVEYNGNILVGDDDLVYPEDAKLANVEEMEATLPQETKPKEEIKELLPEKELEPIGQVFLGFLKRSWLLLLALAGCYVGLFITRKNNAERAENRMNNDRYDDKYVD